MRLLNNGIIAPLSKGVATVALAAGLSACGTVTGGSSDSVMVSAPQAQRANGPSADYPITIGEPYFVNGTEYVPADTLNYDHVGYAALDAGAAGYSGSHHTLPLPSYVEVTSLETGRTILVRLERRGPMSSNDLLSLSPAAMAQLGATAQTPVRVRRVNPPEEHRFLLRAGEAAPLRMDTPQSLLTVLQRRVPASGAASLRGDGPAPSPARELETVELAASDVEEQPPVASPPAAELPAIAAAPAEASNAPPALPSLEDVDTGEAQPAPASGSFSAAFADGSAPAAAPAPTPEPEAAQGRFVVQAAAFSTRERADRVANVLGGVVTQSGRYFRVRTGPFATRGEAEASLANVRRAGYSDARILTSG